MDSGKASVQPTEPEGSLLREGTASVPGPPSPGDTGARQDQRRLQPTNVSPGGPADILIPGLEVYTPNLDHFYLKMLVYGKPGVGKTTLAASAGKLARTGPALLLNIDPGGLAVVGMPGVKVVDIKSWSDVYKVISYLKSLVPSPPPFKTLIIDSLTELQYLNLDAISRARNKGKETDEIYLDEYGISTRQIRRLVRWLRDYPIHVVYTAQEGTSKDKEQDETIFPALTDKLRIALLAYMDIIAYLRTLVKEVEGKPTLQRVAIFQPYGKFVAKDRSPGGRIGMQMANPSIPRILQRIYKEENVTDAENQPS